jgi:hypothetical protein
MDFDLARERRLSRQFLELVHKKLNRQNLFKKGVCHVTNNLSLATLVLCEERT